MFTRFVLVRRDNPGPRKGPGGPRIRLCPTRTSITGVLVTTPSPSLSPWTLPLAPGRTRPLPSERLLGTLCRVRRTVSSTSHPLDRRNKDFEITSGQLPTRVPVVGEPWTGYLWGPQDVDENPFVVVYSLGPLVDRTHLPLSFTVSEYLPCGSLGHCPLS